MKLDLKEFNILLLDDSRVVLSLIGGSLRNLGYQVFEATKPSEAFSLLNKEFFDCIISDYEMPEMNGAEFCKVVKADEGFRQIPIIIMTSTSSEEGSKKSLIHAIENGADDFLSKTSDVDILHIKLQAMLRFKLVREEMVSRQRMNAIKSMVATYNHELNNPLTIAIGFLKMLVKKIDEKDFPEVQKIIDNLARLSDVVKKIRTLETDQTVKYTDNSYMMKIHFKENSVKISDRESKSDKENSHIENRSKKNDDDAA